MRSPKKRLRLAKLLMTLPLMLMGMGLQTTTVSAATEFCALMVLGVGVGCTKQGKRSVVANTYCQTAEPIRWSSKDTPSTIRQAKRENAKIKLCTEKQPKGR